MAKFWGVTDRVLDDINKIPLKMSQKISFLAQFQPFLNSIQDELFQGCSRMKGRGVKRPPLPKICHTHPTVMKLGTVTSYLKKIQKIYESRDTLRGFC